MSNIITRPIGSRFKCKGVEIEVVKNDDGPDGCAESCYFFKNGCWKEADLQSRGACVCYLRDDFTNVIFREVKP